MSSYKRGRRLRFLHFCLFFSLITTALFSSGECVIGSTDSNQDDILYYSYNQFTMLIEELQENYPDTFLYYSIGKTYEGRDIWLIKISDNVTQDEDETKILFTSGVHGNEKPGYEILIYSMKSIIENYTTPNVNNSFTDRIRNIVNTTTLFFIPMVNPDGIEAITRKNRKINNCIYGENIFCGVDINRNFDYKWEELDKHPIKYIFGGFPKRLDRTTVKYPFFDFKSFIGKGNYRGPYPFSENESKAIKQFIENTSISISVDYHTYGEKILYPWYWSKDSPTDRSLFVSIGENISKINGYKTLQGSQWYYIPGALGDWIYEKHGVFSFTIELLKSNLPVYFPLKNQILRLCIDHLLVNLYLSERAIMM